MQRPKHKIRPPPVDHVNNLWHHGNCQRALASTAIQIRRNALFTSPEYALFLRMALGLERKLVVLTDRKMWSICQEESSKGRLPNDIELLLAELPAELHAKLVEARRVAAAEVGG